MKLKYKFVIFGLVGLCISNKLQAEIVELSVQESIDVNREMLAQLDPAAQEEVRKIDTELEQLEDLKGRYRSSASRHENEASRWQFEQNLKQEARRAAQQAELDREMERQIQARIDYLEACKAQIYRK